MVLNAVMGQVNLDFNPTSDTVTHGTLTMMMPHPTLTHSSHDNYY